MSCMQAALLGLAAAGVAMAREVPEAPPPRPVVYYFPTANGDSWVMTVKDRWGVGDTQYRIFESQKGTWTVEDGEERVFVATEIGGPGRFYEGELYAVSKTGVLSRGMYHVVGKSPPPYYLLKLPPNPGEDISVVVSRDKTTKWTRKTIGRERIAVPAGTFEAVVVETWVADAGLPKPYVEQREWFAPRVGVVRRERMAADGGRTFEAVMKSFTPAKGKR